MQLNPKSLGLTAAILSGTFWLIAMIFSLLTGIADDSLTTWGSLHPFFSYSWAGMIIIVIEHLIGGFVGGWIFAWLYNKLLPKTI